MMFAVQPEDPTLKRLGSFKVITINIAYVQNQQHFFYLLPSKMASITPNIFNVAKIYVNVSIQAGQS